MKRSRLKRFGRRAQREQEALEAFRADPPERCQRCFQKGSLDPHHIRPRSLGGTHDIANRAFLCRKCHRGAHDHTLPDWEKWIA